MRVSPFVVALAVLAAASCKSAGSHQAGVKDDETEQPAPDGGELAPTEPTGEAQETTEAGNSPAELYASRAEILYRMKSVEPGTPEYKVAIGSIFFDAPAGAAEADFQKATAAIFAGVPAMQAAAYKFYAFGRTNKKASALGRLDDIAAGDPGFKTFTSLHQDNPEASQAVLGRWTMVNNMMFLYGMIHKGQPIQMLTDPKNGDNLVSTVKDPKNPINVNGKIDFEFNKRAAVLAYEIAELKKQGWRYTAFPAPKNGVIGEFKK